MNPPGVIFLLQDMMTRYQSSAHVTCHVSRRWVSLVAGTALGRLRVASITAGRHHRHLATLGPPPATRTGRGHYGDTVIVIITIVIIIEQVASIPTPHQRQSPELLILRHLIPLMTFIGLHQSSVAISVKLVFPSCTGQVESVKYGSLRDIYIIYDILHLLHKNNKKMWQSHIVLTTH